MPSSSFIYDRFSIIFLLVSYQVKKHHVFGISGLSRVLRKRVILDH